MKFSKKINFVWFTAMFGILCLLGAAISLLV